MTDRIDIGHYLEHGRFIEVLYFGALMLMSRSTGELHASLGVACCATVKPIAQAQRLIRGEATTDPCLYGGPDRHTLLVNEGVHHLLRAIQLDPRFYFPATLEPVTQEVISDLEWFAKEEFHDVTSHQTKGYPPRQAALYARILLSYLQWRTDTRTWKAMSGIEAADDILAKLLSSSNRTAAFLAITPL